MSDVFKGLKSEVTNPSSDLLERVKILHSLDHNNETLEEAYHIKTLGTRSISQTSCNSQKETAYTDSSHRSEERHFESDEEKVEKKLPEKTSEDSHDESERNHPSMKDLEDEDEECSHDDINDNHRHFDFGSEDEDLERELRNQNSQEMEQIIADFGKTIEEKRRQILKLEEHDIRIKALEESEEFKKEQSLLSYFAFDVKEKIRQLKESEKKQSDPQKIEEVSEAVKFFKQRKSITLPADYIEKFKKRDWSELQTLKTIAEKNNDLCLSNNANIMINFWEEQMKRNIFFQES